jgi:hypothetical protein
MFNVNVPAIECFVRGEYLRNLEDSFDKTYPCLIFGMSSIPNKVPLFHFIMEDGGIWWRMPISAFCSKLDAPKQELIDLVLWDSFSYYPSITVFDVLKNKKMEYISRNKQKYSGTYLFTIDWASGDPNNTDHLFSEKPGQHKCGHVIKLDNGNFAIQPNNRILVRDPSFTSNYGKMLIERKINSHEWSAENAPKWITENSDKYYYGIDNIDDRLDRNKQS